MHGWIVEGGIELLRALAPVLGVSQGLIDFVAEKPGSDSAEYLDVAKRLHLSTQEVPFPEYR